MPPPKRQSRLKERQRSGFTACAPAVASAHLTSAAAALAGRCVGPFQRTAVWGQSYSFIFMSLILVFCLLFHIKPHILPFSFAGVPALCPGVPVARGLRTAQQKGAWRTVGPLSCPATQQTPPRTCCSGFWKVNGKAGISLTGKPKCLGFKTGFILVHKLDMLLNFSFPPHSNQSTKKSFGASSTQTHTWGGGGSCGHLRSHQPAQPFIQDPAMPPLPPPNTLAQLEEACRRLEEVSTKTTKPRYTDTRHSELKFHPSPTHHCVSGGSSDIF